MLQRVRQGLPLLLEALQPVAASCSSCHIPSVPQPPTPYTAGPAFWSGTPTSCNPLRHISSASQNEESSSTSSTSDSSQLPSTSDPIAPPQLPAGVHLQDFDELMKVLIHPIARGSVYNGQISNHLLGVNGQWLIDPSKTLQSTLRALHVIRHVLRQNGHIYVVNSNAAMRPLMREAANCCTNPNIWWYWDKWVPGTLTNSGSTRGLFKSGHQPTRRLFRSKGLRMANVHCRQTPAPATKLPALQDADKWTLWRGTKRREAYELMCALLEQENALARFAPQGSLEGPMAKLRLLVVLDPSHNHLALVEAEQRNVMSIGLVNHNKDLSYITWPVYARDFHPGYLHFFLDWLLKVANTRC